MATGDEILIVDASEHDREGLRKLFDEEGYVCTALGGTREAREFVERKFFPAALIELDVEGPGTGLDLVRFIQERSKQTAIVLLTNRRSFEAAVDALRLGVLDVVVKRPDSVTQLRRLVATATDRYRVTDKTGELLREVRGVLDDAFKVMLAMARKIYTDTSIGSGPSVKPRVLIVDDDRKFLQGLAGALSTNDWDVALEMTGGSALDKASSHTFDIVAARDHLTDLPGPMVVKSIQQARGEAIGLVYTAPGPTGHLDRYDQGRVADSERPFTDPTQLVTKLAALVQEVGTVRRERRFLQAFRADYGAFLKRYAELKMRIDQLDE